MGDKTGISWTNATWNVLVGCSVVSPGCQRCYAMREAGTRLASHPKYRGLTLGSKAGPVWSGEVRLWEKALNQPLRWRKPRMIFVNSMSDLFHESVPDEWIDRIFAVMARCPQHVFQILTKRAGRMRAYLTVETMNRIIAILMHECGEARFTWPLPNVWLGVSVEDQSRADERIPLLLATPAAVRFVSAEPLLDPITTLYTSWGGKRLNWVIVGGESGPQARPFNIEWARLIIAQCKVADVRVFMKQVGSKPHYGPGTPGSREFLRDRKGGDMQEWPADLRIREWP